MLRWISQFVLKILGWKIVGDPANELKKKLYIVVPHTSNFDFFLGMLTKWATGIKVNFLGKQSLFFPPLGWILTYYGIVPVKKNSNQIEEIIKLYNSREEMSYGLAPEGTRSRRKVIGRRLVLVNVIFLITQLLQIIIFSTSHRFFLVVRSVSVSAEMEETVCNDTIKFLVGSDTV